MDDHGAGRVSRSGTRSGRARDMKADRDGSNGLSDHTQKRLGVHLRAMYDTIVQQPVPDRFRDLIAQMDSSLPERVDKV